MASRRIAITLSLLGCAGSLTILVLPLPLPPSVPELPARIGQTVQSIVLVLICVWLGVRYAGSVGLGAPIIAPNDPSERTRARAALPRATVIGALTSLLTTALYLLYLPQLPKPFLAKAADYQAPWFARLLYGGFTEEILMRWGIMSWLLSLLVRFRRSRESQTRPGRLAVGCAVLLSAILFGAGHLSMASYIAGGLTMGLALFIIGINLPTGIAAGLAYARHGIECAMATHIGASLVALIAERLVSR